MKNLILITIGLIISIPIFGGLVEDTTRRKNSPNSITKKNFETSFTNQLVKYIETGDVTPLLDLAQEDDITFYGLSGNQYEKSENKEYFKQFIKKYLNVRSKDLTILRIDKEYYDNYYHPLGLNYRITILYPNSERYDQIKIYYSHSGKLRGITINDNLNENSYVDADLHKIYGSQYGPEGESVTPPK